VIGVIGLALCPACCNPVACPTREQLERSESEDLAWGVECKTPECREIVAVSQRGGVLVVRVPIARKAIA
jgi:hypothetical protein